jgi:hypothetical protein
MPAYKQKDRTERAIEREKISSKLSISEKIEKLDTDLGKGMGARKQRARYAFLLEESLKPKVVKEKKENTKQTKTKTKTTK